MIRGAAALLLVGCLVRVESASAEVVDGRTVFERHCASCHSVDAGAPSGAGPGLADLLGRPVGGDPAFDYSPVLREAREAGMAWDAAALERFLADPEEAFPGNWMSANGLRTASDRAAVVEYLLRSGR